MFAEIYKTAIFHFISLMNSGHVRLPRILLQLSGLFLSVDPCV